MHGQLAGPGDPHRRELAGAPVVRGEKCAQDVGPVRRVLVALVVGEQTGLPPVTEAAPGVGTVTR